MTKNTTTYAQLNIGRNIGEDPMTDASWHKFLTAAKVRLACATLDVEGRATCGTDRILSISENNTETHLGTGTWDGVTEESARVSIYWPNGVDVDSLKRMASNLAQMFEQDSIAVVTGSILCEPIGN